MYVIEITEDKLQSMAEHVEKGLRHMGKLMQCIEELEEDFSESGAYGEKGRLGMRDEEEDWWDEEDKKHKDYSGSKDRYGKRMRRY